MINANQIESIELGTDTCVCLMNGKRLFVEESEEEIIERICMWYARLHGHGEQQGVRT